MRIWAREGGPPLATLRGHNGDVTCLAFSPAGKFLASAGLDHTIRLWDLDATKEAGVLRGHTGEVTAIAYSPDGKTLASVSWDRTVRLWEANTGHLRATFSGHANVITSVAFAPDGTRAASASLDRTVKFWDIATGREAGSLRVQSSNEAKSTAAASFAPRETPGPHANQEETTAVPSPPSWCSMRLARRPCRRPANCGRRHAAALARGPAVRAAAASGDNLAG